VKCRGIFRLSRNRHLRSGTTLRNGFSLVELLIVIGIIAALISILMPMLARARRSALQVQCMNNLRQLGIGVYVYTAQWKGALPWDGYGEGDRPVRPVGYWDDPSLWFNAAPQCAGDQAYSTAQEIDAAGGAPLPHGGDRGILVCPMSNNAAPGPKDDLITNGYFMMWGWDTSAAPAKTPIQRKTFMCYGFNTQLDGGLEDRNVNHRVTIRITSIPDPASTALIVEKLMMPREFSPPFSSSVMQSEVSWREFSTRHDGGGSILFVDGHVAWFNRADVSSPPGAPFDYNQPGLLVWNPAGAAN
jgi:prepilin-type N-terminal cleavage/methylation domain-containing protein/prepilin-type processing-associated H-X9-DG protein